MTLQLTPTLLSNATYYSIGGGFVVKEERINAKKKIAINVLSFLNRKSVRAT
jgi:L-serine dehydratase